MRVVCFYLLLILSQSCLFAQSTSYKLFKTGFQGFAGVTNENYLNNMVEGWFNDIAEANNGYLSEDPILLPFNIEYGYQPFFTVHPTRFLQIGMKLDVGYSNLVAEFQNETTNQSYDYQIKVRSYTPGLFSYLTLGKFEIGGGLIHSFSNVNVKDDFFGYYDTWYGKDFGYEIIMGFSTSKEKPVGFTMSIKYRGLLIGNYEDSFNRDIIIQNGHDKIMLDMSGFIISMGLYGQFLKIDRQKDAN